MDKHDTDWLFTTDWVIPERVSSSQLAYLMVLLHTIGKPTARVELYSPERNFIGFDLITSRFCTQLDVYKRDTVRTYTEVINALKTYIEIIKI